MFIHKKEAYKFSDKKHSIIGCISLILGIVSCIAFLIISYISSLSGGNGNIIIGIVGMVLFGVSMTGFFLGIKACKEKDIYYNAPIIGIVINGIFSVLYLILYMVGISL